MQMTKFVWTWNDVNLSLKHSMSIELTQRLIITCVVIADAHIAVGSCWHRRCVRNINCLIWGIKVYHLVRHRRWIIHSVNLLGPCAVLSLKLLLLKLGSHLLNIFDRQDIALKCFFLLSKCGDSWKLRLWFMIGLRSQIYFGTCWTYRWNAAWNILREDFQFASWNN